RPDYTVTEQMGRTYPSPAEPSEEEAARYDELAEKIEGEAASEAEEAEFAALEEQLGREDFTDDQMARAGVFLWVGYHGKIEASYGLIRPEDREEAEAAGHCQPSRHGTKAESQAEKPPYSAALSEDLRRIRTGAVQTALLDTPDLALELLTLALTSHVYGGALPLGLSTTEA
ncbi:MAG: plasmid stabilization protein, partial [Pseudomonadota bacterium]